MKQASRFFGTALSLVMAASISGCLGGGGGGGGGGDDTGGATPTADPFAQKASFSDDDIRHFLNRTHFANTQAAFDDAKNQGMEAYVDSMLVFPALNSTQAETDAFDELVDPGDPPGLEGKFPSTSDIQQWWLHLMVNNENAFQEQLAMFWHDLFATSARNLDSSRRHWMVDQINLLREHGAGNFKNILLWVSRDPAMLDWLDGIRNDKFAPNENYAREFWELFSLGADNGYTQADILEGSQAFSGYRDVLDTDTGLRSVVFDPDEKVPGIKAPFGVLIADNPTGDDYQEMVDITFDEREVAEFLATRLLWKFVDQDPAETTIDALAQIIRDENYEMTPVLKKMFLSEAFYATEAHDGFVKTPVEFAIGFIRQSGLVVSNSSLRSNLSAMGMEVTNPPDVFGWGQEENQGRGMLTEQAMISRANFIRDCIVDRTNQEDAGIDVTDYVMPSTSLLAEDLIRHLEELMQLTLTQAEVDDLKDFLDNDWNFDPGDNTQVIGTPSLFTAANPDHVDERLRGLLYILANHPTYMIR